MTACGIDADNALRQVVDDWLSRNPVTPDQAQLPSPNVVVPQEITQMEQAFRFMVIAFQGASGALGSLRQVFGQFGCETQDLTGQPQDAAVLGSDTGYCAGQGGGGRAYFLDLIGRIGEFDKQEQRERARATRSAS